MKLNNLVYSGMCILDLSKVFIDEFHYDYIKINMARTQDLFTDTGNLIYEFKTEYVCKYFTKDKEMSDFSNYSA